MVCRLWASLYVHKVFPKSDTGGTLWEAMKSLRRDVSWTAGVRLEAVCCGGQLIFCEEL